MTWGDVWESQVELNDLFIDALDLLTKQMSLNRYLIIIVVIWLLILTYKLFKNQQKTV